MSHTCAHARMGRMHPLSLKNVSDCVCVCVCVCVRTLYTQTTRAKEVRVSVGGSVAVQAPMTELRNAWEETAFHLERLQVCTCNRECMCV